MQSILPTLNRHIPLLLGLQLLLAACGAADAGRAGDGNPGLDRCTTDRDCPVGLVCTANACVADDGLPPELPDPRTFLPPSASKRFVFALSPEASTVAVIDPERMRVESIPLPAEPVDLAVIPGEDTVVVLSRDGAAVSSLSLENGDTHLSIQRIGRRLSSLSLAPDASWALIWTLDGKPLDAGAEGLVLLVDVRKLRAGTPQAAIERVAGRRHTHVFFRSADGLARDSVVVGKEEVAIFNLADPAARPGPERIALPPEFAELATRRVAASSDGAFVLIASLASPELLVLDVERRSLGTLALPGAPSDLAISSDGRLAVATLRAVSKAAFFPLPGALAAPGLIRTADVSLPGASCEVPGCTVAPGQVRLAPDASFALLFTNAQSAKSFGRLDLSSGEWEIFNRIRKEVQTVSIAPDGKHALILHRPRPDSTAAEEYEREVDRSQGYSVVELVTGTTQLVLTGDVPPRDAVFAAGSRYAAITLRNDSTRVFRVDAIDLETLVCAPLPLASAPEFAGPLASTLAHKIWVTQTHPAGRISFVDLEDRSTRTVTGYELNGEIE